LEAGIRHDRIELSVRGERCIDDELVAVARRQVGVVDVDRVNRPIVCLEPLDDRGADAAARAGDEGDACHP
jgi:hypothetical protein